MQVLSSKSLWLLYEQQVKQSPMRGREYSTCRGLKRNRAWAEVKPLEILRQFRSSAPTPSYPFASQGFSHDASSSLKDHFVSHIISRHSIRCQLKKFFRFAHRFCVHLNKGLSLCRLASETMRRYLYGQLDWLQPHSQPMHYRRSDIIPGA